MPECKICGTEDEDDFEMDGYDEESSDICTNCEEFYDSEDEEA
jgi:hypothetical protein